MPLPFNNTHNNRRQFQCFVCGVLQPDFASFKEHVRTNHEEGREYILCPMEHCKAPVRDLRAHYKSCHKHTACPHDRQLKALVWKDPKDPSKKKKKVSFEEGYFPSAKNRKRLHYDSSWEREVFEVLEKMDDVVKYEKEPVAIEYFFDGERKNYLPDLKLYFRDGSKEIWEVKPLSQSNLAVNEAKWHACGEFCKKRGWDFKIITEVGLDKIKNHLRKGNNELRDLL